MSANTQNVVELNQQPSARFEISAVVDGFPVNISVEGRADNLRAMIDRLKQLGAQPPTQAQATAHTSTEAPRCNLHNKPMKASRKPGSWFCPTRLGDGSYCTEKVDS